MTLARIIIIYHPLKKGFGTKSLCSSAECNLFKHITDSSILVQPLVVKHSFIQTFLSIVFPLCLKSVNYCSIVAITKHIASTEVIYVKLDGWIL